MDYICRPSKKIRRLRYQKLSIWSVVGVVLTLSSLWIIGMELWAYYTHREIGTSYHMDEGHKAYMNQTETVVDVSDKLCYRYVTIDAGVTTKLDDSELKARGCKQRLPDAIIFGVKKSGTTTLKNFLSYHPDIAFAPRECNFFNKPPEFQKGLGHYKSEMSYSTAGQVSMEKTPDYYYYSATAESIKRALPKVKLIAILRDPIQRALSDFVHVKLKYCSRPSTNSTGSLSLSKLDLCEKRVEGYYIAKTFQESVIDFAGSVRAECKLISKGFYERQYHRFLHWFKREDMLAIDGEAFLKDPYPAVKRVEQFLGIRDYFTSEHFYFDTQKGFFCLAKPIPNNCMRSSKGRPHPKVNEETLRKLRKFYRPYNARLSKLLETNFSWS